MDNGPDKKQVNFFKSLKFWRHREKDKVDAVLTGTAPWSGPASRNPSQTSVIELERKQSHGSSTASEDVGVQTSQTRIVERIVNPPECCCHQRGREDASRTFLNAQESLVQQERGICQRNDSGCDSWHDAQAVHSRGSSGVSIGRDICSLPASRCSLQQRTTTSNRSLRSGAKKTNSNRSSLGQDNGSTKSVNRVVGRKTSSNRSIQKETVSRLDQLRFRGSSSRNSKEQLPDGGYANWRRTDPRVRGTSWNGNPIPRQQNSNREISDNLVVNPACIDCHRAVSCQYHVPYHASQTRMNGSSPDIMRNLEEAARQLSRKEYARWSCYKQAVFHPLGDDPADSDLQLNWKIIIFDLGLILICILVFTWWYSCRWSAHYEALKADGLAAVNMISPCDDCEQFFNPIKSMREHFKAFTDAFVNMRRETTRQS